MSTTTTTASIDLPLGTGPDGGTVSWRLADEAGRPLHGLIMGPAGSGGTTALMRLATSAHAAGVQPNIVSLNHDVGHPDPAWVRAPRGVASWYIDADDLIWDLDKLLAETGPAVPRLFLVDGGSGLRAAPEQWTALVRQAARVQASIVARVNRPILQEVGDGVLRSRLAADGQYLALGRPASSPLVRDLLPGYTPPARRGRPGTGVYGRARCSTEVTVTA